MLSQNQAIILFCKHRMNWEIVISMLENCRNSITA
ncbi:hypothetical protein [Lentilactobacillus hilgardii]